MAEPLFSLVNIAVLVFSVTSMLSVGFSYTLREIVEPLRNVRGVLLALAANFALVPLLAYGVTRLLSLEERRRARNGAVQHRRSDGCRDTELRRPDDVGDDRRHLDGFHGAPVPDREDNGHAH